VEENQRHLTQTKAYIANRYVLWEMLKEVITLGERKLYTHMKFTSTRRMDAGVFF
jgi:hypothetical protein